MLQGRFVDGRLYPVDYADDVAEDLLFVLFATLAVYHHNTCTIYVLMKKIEPCTKPPPPSSSPNSSSASSAFSLPTPLSANPPDAPRLSAQPTPHPLHPPHDITPALPSPRSFHPPAPPCAYHSHIPTVQYIAIDDPPPPLLQFRRAPVRPAPGLLVPFPTIIPPAYTAGVLSSATAAGVYALFASAGVCILIPYNPFSRIFSWIES